MNENQIESRIAPDSVMAIKNTWLSVFHMNEQVPFSFVLIIECGVVIKYEGVVQFLLKICFMVLVVGSTSNHTPCRYKSLVITSNTRIYVRKLIHWECGNAMNHSIIWHPLR